MDNYTNIPERRLAQIVKKYVHHQKIKLMRG